MLRTRRAAPLTPIIALLFVLATAVFLWGVVSYVIAQKGDSQKMDQAKTTIAWGIIGLFIMASAWGIVKLLCNFFDTCAGITFPGP